MEKLNPVSRKDAVRALLSLEEEAFGHDKGSGDAYIEWAADRGLCTLWDGEETLGNEHSPPDFFELLMAVGVDPREIVEAGGINPACFPPPVCKAYGFRPLQRKTGAKQKT